MLNNLFTSLSRAMQRVQQRVTEFGYRLAAAGAVPAARQRQATLPLGSPFPEKRSRRQKPMEPVGAGRIVGRDRGGVRLVPRCGRNAPCRCGSERKFKKCCGQPPLPLRTLKKS